LCSAAANRRQRFFVRREPVTVQRKSSAPGAALTAALLSAGLAATLAGCSSDGSGGSGPDSKVNNMAATASPPQPGKYRTLPEPCGAVDRGTLRSLLPGIENLKGGERQKAYEGQAAITYDTDRRVGCRWKAESPAGARHLTIDFERVVSYDPAVSDDDRAQELYEKMAAAAHIQVETPTNGGTASAPASPSGSGKNGTDKGGESDASTKTGKGQEKGTDASGSASADSTSPTAPRALDGLADAAYLDDHLVDQDSGVHRDVTLVFRSSNVIVTIKYDQWSATPSKVPQSEELQNKAHRLAHELIGRFNA
jgi:hypothetical protein